MQLFSLNAENWRMDGGAGFGLVPKTIWSKVYPADELNYIPMKSRCLLIKTDTKLVLIDAGMGRKRGDKYYAYKYFFGDDSIEKDLIKYGFKPDQITDVILTHLHDDHVGGCTKFNSDGNVELVFPKAKHWISKSQWDWAINPNKREAGTYFKDNFVPLLEAGVVEFVESEGYYFDQIYFKIVDGHTRGQIIPILNFENKSLVYVADFIPSTAHFPIPYIAAVDIVPLVSLEEKEEFLKVAAKNNYYFYFEHDFFTEVCSVEVSEKGVVPGKKMTLEDFINE